MSWTSPTVTTSETTTRLGGSTSHLTTTMFQWHNCVHIHQSPWTMSLLFRKPTQLLHPKRNVFSFWIIVLCLNKPNITFSVSSSSDVSNFDLILRSSLTCLGMLKYRSSRGSFPTPSVSKNQIFHHLKLYYFNLILQCWIISTCSIGPVSVVRTRIIVQ